MQCISVIGEVYLNVHTSRKDRRQRYTKSGHCNFLITTVGMRPRDIQIRDIHGSRYSNRVVTFVDLASKRIYIFINEAYLYTIAIHMLLLHEKWSQFRISSTVKLEPPCTV